MDREIGEDELDRAWRASRIEIGKKATQLGNWTMAANGAGLAFVLTTARESAIANTKSLETIYLVFLVGLILGFAGHVALMIGQAFSTMSLALRYSTSQPVTTVQEGKASPESVRETVADWGKHAGWLGDTLGSVGATAYIFASLAAAAGLSAPLFMKMF